MITVIEVKYQSDSGYQKTPITRPYGRASYEVSFVNICEKIDRVITAPHCMLSNLKLSMYYYSWLNAAEILKPVK